jgi:BCD family chlorophyll transporter-like MFS transporter
MTTSTLNRIMVVELALPAVLPGSLVALHYLVQIARPRMGYGSDLSRRRTPWIVGGMGVLAAGGIAAALATAWMGTHPATGIAAAVAAFLMIGMGVSAAGTSLLALLAQRVAPERRASAATLVWLMMIAGFALTAGAAGNVLDPYSPARLVAVTSVVSVVAFVVTCVAMRGLEASAGQAPIDVPPGDDAATSAPRFAEALAQVWREPAARRFTVFVFVSMLAYSAQDLILEPFAGSALGFTPGESTRLSGTQHGGVLLGMIAAALAGRRRFGSLMAWQIGGCLLSALALLGLVAAGVVGPAWPFRSNVFLLGVANGAFSIAAIAAMMKLANESNTSRPGVRMGLWGAAQALAFGFGGLAGTVASDLARLVIGSPALAYAAVFAVEALLFVAAAALVAKGMSWQADWKRGHPHGSIA